MITHIGIHNTRYRFTHITYSCKLMVRQPIINWNKHVTHGRINEINEIRGILKQIEEGAPSRIVAITGPSGVGKVQLSPFTTY